MNKLNNTSKIVIGVVVVAIIVVLIFVYGTGGSAPASNTTSTNGTAANSNGQNATATNVVAGSGSQTNPPSRGVTVPPIVIHFVTPVANDQWKIGTSNPIAWDKAGNFSGEIDLVDAKTHNFVGVILSETGPNQTSYSWDTREYSLARYSPLAKEVIPGTYAIRLKFDGNNLPTLYSSSFTISN